MPEHAYPRGEDHHNAKYSEAQVRRALRLIDESPKKAIERLAPGAMRQIAEETGLSVRVVMHLRSKTRWANIIEEETSA